MLSTTRCLLGAWTILCGSIAVQAGPLFMDLGDLSGGSFSSYANGVSADGSTVAGVSKSGSGTEVLLWTSDGGMRSLNDVLPNDLAWEAAWWSGP